jgi:hypothetical protein
MRGRFTSSIWLCSLWIAAGIACATTQTDVYEDEYLSYVDDCQQTDVAKRCVKAAIVIEYNALEANKAGDDKAAKRAWDRAADAAQRACDLGDSDACGYAERLRSRQTLQDRD